MKALIAALALGVAMAACAALRAADDVKADQKVVVVVARVQDLNLTDEQETKIADIRKDFRPKVQEAARDLAAVVKEEVEKARAVLTPEQQKKLQEIKEERKEFRAEGVGEQMAHLGDLDLTDAEIEKIGEIRKDFRPRIEKALEGLKGVLSDEQKKAREEAFTAGKTRRQLLEGLKLTNEQKEKVTAIGKDVATLVREEMEKVRDVLSAEQKEKLADLKDERKERVRDRMAHRIANLKDLNLTEEQMTKLTEIRKEYRPKVQEAGNKLRATIREEVEAIVAALKG
jgi:Spy/CpxP family protein refolding chaperone